MRIVYVDNHPEKARQFPDLHGIELMKQAAKEYAEGMAERYPGNFVYICAPLRAISETKVSYIHTWEDMEDGKIY